MDLCIFIILIRKKWWVMEKSLTSQCCVVSLQSTVGKPNEYKKQPSRWTKHRCDSSLHVPIADRTTENSRGWYVRNDARGRNRNCHNLNRKLRNGTNIEWQPTVSAVEVNWRRMKLVRQSTQRNKTNQCKRLCDESEIEWA